MIIGDETGAVEYLKQGKIIAYPTEGVYGLGCDPYNKKSVKEIIKIKQRPSKKTFIIVTCSINQLEDIVDVSKITNEVLKSWPGAYTWLMPAKKNLPEWLINKENGLIAVRVSNHETIKNICIKFGKPIISTSANINNKNNITTENDIKKLFKSKIDYLVVGKIGKSKKPTTIKNMLTGEVIRK